MHMHMHSRMGVRGVAWRAHAPAVVLAAWCARAATDGPAARMYLGKERGDRDWEKKGETQLTY